MVSSRRSLLVVLASLTLLPAPGAAWADDLDDEPPPPVDPYQPRPVYVAPLSQTTQTTYVPQSVALSGPGQLPSYDDNRPPPAGYTAVWRKRRGLIVGGAVTLGVSYSISAMVAAIGEDSGGDGENEAAAMWIPVAGPFLQMRETDSATADFFLVGLGGAQLLGAIMLYYGVTSPTRVFVRNDLLGSMTVTPMAGAGVQGVALSGQF